MKTSLRTLCLGIAVSLVTVAGVSSAEEKRASPHEKVSAVVGKANVTVEYGRPLKKSREIFGALVPYGDVWRTGADEATTLTTDADLVIGDVTVPKGKYSLFTLPTKDSWKLIINKTPDQWGAYKYDAKQDLGRTSLKVSAAPASVEQFTIAIKTGADKKSSLELAWDKTVASVSIASKP